MKRLLSFALCAMLCLAPIAHAQNAAVGSWDITLLYNEVPVTSQLIIKQEGDNLVGMMKSPRGEYTLDSVIVKGSDITMTMTAHFQDQDLVVTYTGKVEKDKMSGDADFVFARGTWSAVPHKE